MSDKNQYSTRNDFVAYFLQSPTTKEPEFEIRISGPQKAVQTFQQLLRDKQIPFRKIGLDIFPPPLILLLEYNSIKDALGVLHSWFANNKSKITNVMIVKPDAVIEEIKDENQILKIMDDIR